MEDITDGEYQSNGGMLSGIAVNQSTFESIGSNDGCNDADIQFAQQGFGVAVTGEEDISMGEEVDGVTDIYLPMSNDFKYVGPHTGVKLW